MPPTCTICSHERRREIDEALVRGESLRHITTRMGLPNHSALARHKKSHISPALTRLAQRKDERHHAKLLDRVEALIARTEGILDQAEEGGQLHLSLSAIRELRGLSELLGKVTGELDERPQQVVNLIASPDWLAIRTTLMEALSPYPAARAAVASRLQELGAGQ